MLKNLLNISLVLGAGLNAYSQQEKDKLQLIASFNEYIESGVRRGAFIVETKSKVELTPDLEVIVKQISQHADKFEKPILIFKDDQIVINDPEKLNELLSRPGATITSS